MPEPTIINIINFIRALEPRDAGIDLLEPVRRQIELVNGYGFPATWLLQYDSLTDERFVGLLRDGLDERQEIGVWFELVQPLVERAGARWRGRFPWDWHSDVGFSIGYTPEERERIADVFMEEFRAVFGRYPRSMGSWVFDAHLLSYLSERYGIIAACNCKDQWGTDGYTLWGGYWNQAYYPSAVNAFIPAQSEEMQIPIPVFRMLGSDPIYQYDAGLSVDSGCAEPSAQGVVTLEPVYPEGGGSHSWVRWFLDLTTTGPSLSFGYAQVGQENSFGWLAMAEGLTDQFAQLSDRVERGALRVETLSESGAWYRERYPVTPASAVTALSDWQGGDRHSVWYNSRFYRTNLFWEGGRLRIRDIHLFDERYPERYLTEPCVEHRCVYDTLPIIDGFLWSGDGTLAGLRPVFVSDGEGFREMAGGDLDVTAEGDDELRIAWPLESGIGLDVALTPSTMAFHTDADGWGMLMTWAECADIPISMVTDGAVSYSHEGHGYRLVCASGRAMRVESGLLFLPTEGTIRLSLDVTVQP